MTQVPTPAGSPPTVDGRNEQDFARIWGRVMPLEQAGCPIRVGRPPEESPSAPPQEREDMCSSTPAVPEVPTPLPCPREAPPPSRAHISPATQPDVPLLGSGSAIYGEQLQMYIDQEATQAQLDQFYSKLSGFEAKVLDLFLNGLSYAEIADQVDRPAKSVDNAVQRIRRKLAK